MSEMKIPKEPLSTPPKMIPAANDKEAAPVPQAYRLDSIEAFSDSGQTSLSTRATSEAPALPQPEADPVSMLAYFKAISGAELAFRQQLSANDQMDLALRRRSSMSAMNRAQAMQVLFDKRTAALAQLESDAKKALEELQKKIAEMQRETKEQQSLIDKINQGNGLEKQNNQEMARAYEHYLNQLNSIGAIDNGDGTYTIPEGAEEKFKEITKEYQAAVSKFDAYSKERQAELKAYNAATTAYNQRAAANNQAINELMNKYQLGDYLQGRGLPIPRQSQAELRNPNQINDTPSLNPVSSLSEVLYEGIYRSLYEEKIVKLDREIARLYLQSTQPQTTLVTDPVPDPLLNTKPLSERIFPDSTKAHSKKSLLLTSTNSLLPAIGVDSDQLATLLGRALLMDALRNIKALKESDEKQIEKKLEMIADKLLLFSISMMGNQSLQALLPSVSPISQSLSSLPADSPAFALLFALSFANRTGEEAHFGINKEALQVFLKEIPELEGLSEEDRTQLEAILNLGQLMVAAKMVETTLGMPGLTAQILTPLSSLDQEATLLEGAAERKPVLENLKTGIETKFIEQGYPKEEAQFLSRVGVQLSEQGPLTPAAASVPIPAAVNKPLLIDSVKAALVLSKTPLKEADAIAHEVVDSTLAETPYSSAKQLRSALETHLQDLGIRDKAPEIARQAVVIPPKEDAALPAKTTLPQLVSLLEKRSMQLLVPQLGAEIAKTVTEELMKTLFGNPHPDTRTIGDVKSPYALVNVIQNQLYHLHLDQNKEWTETVVQTFKETIKSMESFYSFSLKLMDPAYLLVYSGIIHGEQGRKKSVDIPI